MSDRLQNLFREMTSQMPSTTGHAAEAVLSLDATGRYIGANKYALELLGVTLAELRASPPDRFAVQPPNQAEQAALRAEWESDGSQPLVGTTGLKRADGTTIRVSYAIESASGGFCARMWQVEGEPEAPPSVFSVGSVLREWRAAERNLAELLPGTSEWRRTVGEIELLRDRYQELFKTVMPQA